jgi:dTDP-4-amino-4,6-dideoxygalactose transaminase
MSQDAWKRFSDPGFQHYEVEVPGFKYNMTDIQAALGIHQLARVSRNAVRRRAIWDRYDAAFADLPVVCPAPVESDVVHARHLYTILVGVEEVGKTRDLVLDELTRLNIGTGVHYSALHLQPYYRDRFGYKPGDFPNAEMIGSRTISLPLSAKLTDRDVEDVIDAVRATITRLPRS